MIRDVHLGSGFFHSPIPDPDFFYPRIPDPGVKKVSDPGYGSAKLKTVNSYACKANFGCKISTTGTELFPLSVTSR